MNVILPRVLSKILVVGYLHIRRNKVLISLFSDNESTVEELQLLPASTNFEEKQLMFVKKIMNERLVRGTTNYSW